MLKINSYYGQNSVILYQNNEKFQSSYGGYVLKLR